MKSIRSTTTWLTFIGISLLGIILCTSVYLVTKQILTKNFDQDLLIEFQNISGVSRVWPDDDFYVDIDFDVATQFNAGGSRLFQVWSTGKGLGDYLEVIDRSPMLEELGINLPHPIEDTPSSPYYYDLTFPNELPARAVIMRTNTQWIEDEDSNVEVPEIKIDIVVARERVSLDNSISMLLHWMLIIAAIFPIVSFIIVYYAISFGTSPLKRLADNISRIEGSNEKISLDDRWVKEIIPVVNTFNQLLDRLEKGVKRERRFTNDLAHEMRTPLAELRIVTDVVLRANDKDRLVKGVQQINTLSHSISELVNGMLLLTRIQSDNSQLSLTPVDISPLICLHIERTQKRALARSINVIVDIPNVLITETDPVLLMTIFSNLMNNAIAHAPQNSDVSLCLKKQASGFDFSIENFAPDLTNEDLTHLQEPFWRKEQSRHSGNHFGLGLAIVEEAVDCLNLQLKVNLNENKYITFTCQSQS